MVGDAKPPSGAATFSTFRQESPTPLAFCVESLATGRIRIQWRGIREFDEIPSLMLVNGEPTYVAREGSEYVVMYGEMRRLAFDGPVEDLGIRRAGPDIEVYFRRDGVTLQFRIPIHPLL